MELRILCKHLIADELNGKFTVGENSADTVGITLPRYYQQHDLSTFSFRITAAGKCKKAAVQILERDSYNEKTVHLLWTVTSEFTAIPDEFDLVLTGINSDNSVTVKFRSCPVKVNSDSSWEFLPSPELSEQLLNRVQLEVEKAKAAAEQAKKYSETPAPAEIYPATDDRLGGIKSGGNISVSADGIVTVLNCENLKSDIKNTNMLAVQIAHPNNFLIYDDVGKPSVMVAIPKFYLDEIIDGANHTVHPAFIINGVEQEVIYISKYQNVVENGRAYSLPMKNPQTNVTFDQAYNYCKAKGEGWHLMTNAEWAAIALWCKKNGTMPKGNNSYGKDFSETSLPQKAVAAAWYNGKTAKTKTGSGSAAWYHDGTFAGIADLNGNVSEWVSGARLYNGEIQILPDNNAADTGNSCAADSSLWKAFMPDGSYADPGTGGTLKWDYTDVISTPGGKGNFYLNTVIEHEQAVDNAYGIKQFKSLETKSGFDVPQIMKSIALFPDGNPNYNNEVFCFRNKGELMTLRGGGFYHSQQSGVFYLDQTFARNKTDSIRIGFRCAYYGPVINS